MGEPYFPNVAHFAATINVNKQAAKAAVRMRWGIGHPDQRRSAARGSSLHFRQEAGRPHQRTLEVGLVGAAILPPGPVLISTVAVGSLRLVREEADLPVL
jgi:hypothetical protein